MASVCVRVTELPHTSRLFTDYTYHFDRVARFYPYSPHQAGSFREAASALDYPEPRRAELVDVLRQQNGDSRALELLARPGTAVVATGQQVGLCSGPAYTIYKALTAAALARRLTASGIPAVPVFWLATEDHDYAEINHCWLFGPARQPVKIEVAGTNPDRRPVGSIPLDESPVGAVRAALEGLAFGPDIAALVEETYAPGQTLGAAFATLMRRLLGSQDLLYLDPMHPQARRLAAPLLAQAVAAAPLLAARVLERNRDLADAGYHAQVHVEDDTSFVFLLEGGSRRTLLRHGDEYLLDGRRYSAAELAARAHDLSPNALLRPVIQDFVLPTVAYVGGPAELAYLAQAQVIYRELLGRMPVAVPRQSVTLLDARAAKLMSRYRLALGDFFHGDSLAERMARTLVPPELGDALARARAEAGRVLDETGAAIATFDTSLRDAFETSRRKVEYQLGKVERKVAREALRRSERAASDAAYLTNLVYPNKHLQERLYSILPFLAAHGPDLLERLAGEMNLDCPDHRVVAV